ncbi:MAG: ComEC/Rec2 family competence protein [Saprospirales bacterium]|nr:ComEC/Rec2 family competence protein [Saprospirales bacterium]
MLYAQTGATHVLSVSGLHVGLIYLLPTSFSFFKVAIGQKAP